MICLHTLNSQLSNLKRHNNYNEIVEYLNEKVINNFKIINIYDDPHIWERTFIIKIANDDLVINIPIYLSSNSNWAVLMMYEYLNNSPLYDIKIEFFNNIFYFKIYFDTNLIPDLIKKNIYSQAFTFYLNMLYKKKQISFSFSDIKDNINFNYNHYIEEPKLKLKLYKYQRKALHKMLNLENGIELDVDINCDLHLNDLSRDIINEDDTIKFNPFKNTINYNNEKTLIKFKVNGGILADEMGLGKTITSLSLIHLNPSTCTEQYINNKLYTKATLISCPNHLTKQWYEECKNIFINFKNLKIIMLLTKNTHLKLTVADIKEADIIIVANEFLINFNHYARFELPWYFSPSMDNKYNSRIEAITSKETNFNNDAVPLLECFHYHRIIIDEAHELFDPSTKGYYKKDSNKKSFLIHLLSNLKTDKKWFVSGTPFIETTGFVNIIKFLGIKFKLSNYKNIYKIEDLFLSKKYIMENILNKIIIRNQHSNIKEIEIFGYEEEIIWTELTEIEKKLYENTKAAYPSYTLKLQQIVCHPLVAESFKKYFKNSNEIVNLDDIKDTLISHHENRIIEYNLKIEKLNTNNQAYHMLKNSYNVIVASSKFMLEVLTNINKKIEDKEDACIICLDEFEDPVFTQCGHIFCKDCITQCLNSSYHKKCPLCKTDLKNTELVSIEQKEKSKKNKNLNPIIEKYGSKLGKIIILIKSIINDPSNRIIIFSQWDEMLTLIGRSLWENKIENSFLRGSVYSKNTIEEEIYNKHYK